MHDLREGEVIGEADVLYSRALLGVTCCVPAYILCLFGLATRVQNKLIEWRGWEIGTVGERTVAMSEGEN
jgi:hypothetical protein